MNQTALSKDLIGAILAARIQIGILFLLLISSLHSYSQTEIATLNVSNGFNEKSVERIVSSVNAKGETALIIFGKKSCNAYLLDSKFDIIQKVENMDCPFFTGLHKTLGQFWAKNNTISIFFSNTPHTKYARWNIFFDKKFSDIQEVNIPHENEIFVSCYELGDFFQFVTLSKLGKNDQITLTTFKSLEPYKPESYSFNYSKAYQEPTGPLLKSMVKQRVFMAEIVETTTISPKIFNSVANTRFPVKFYYTKDSLILSVDKHSTEIWVINQAKKTAYFKKFSLNNETKKKEATIKLEQTMPDIGSEVGSNGRYNSFIDLGSNTIWIGQLLGPELIIQAQNIKDNGIRKTYSIKEDSPLDWNNTPIIQNTHGDGLWFGTPTQSERTLDKTNQLLRRMRKGEFGIAINPYHQNGLQEMIVGSYLPGPSNKGGIVGNLAGAAAFQALDAPFYVWGSVAFNYSSYSLSKIAYFKTMIRENNLVNIPGVMEKSVFENLQAYEDKIGEPVKGKSIFKYNENYIYGYFDKKLKSYRLISFAP